MKKGLLNNINIIEDEMIKKIKEIFSKIKKRLFGKLCECLPKKKKGRGRPKKK
jgi:hypothetical protein|tara:strand:- start:752 stop:910 length:159 start_codon:yes stop_codon:yes gene_type:complete